MTETVLVLLVLLTLKHLIVDFFCQTPYQYLNKGTYLHPGGLLHSGIHALVTFVILVLVCPTLAGPVLFLIVSSEFAIHYHMDWMKVNVCKSKNYTPTNSEKYWWWLGIDQFVHQMNYILILVLVAKCSN